MVVVVIKLVDYGWGALDTESTLPLPKWPAPVVPATQEPGKRGSLEPRSLRKNRETLLQ